MCAPPAMVSLGAASWPALNFSIIACSSTVKLGGVPDGAPCAPFPPCMERVRRLPVTLAARKKELPVALESCRRHEAESIDPTRSSSPLTAMPVSLVSQFAYRIGGSSQHAALSGADTQLLLHQAPEREHTVQQCFG